MCRAFCDLGALQRASHSPDRRGGNLSNGLSVVPSPPREDAPLVSSPHKSSRGRVLKNASPQGSSALSSAAPAATKRAPGSSPIDTPAAGAGKKFTLDSVRDNFKMLGEDSATGGAVGAAAVSRVKLAK